MRTDIAGFVGIAVRGPLHRPVRVESWTQFVSTFGGHTSQGYLAYAVEGFLANGGRACWVVRVADPRRARPAELLLHDGAGRPSLRLRASSPGIWGRRVTVVLVPSGGDRFTLDVSLPGGDEELWSGVTTRIASLDLTDGDGRRTLRLAVYDPALWHVDIAAAVERQKEGRFTLRLMPRRRAVEPAFDRVALDPLAGEVPREVPPEEVYPDLCLEPGTDRYVPQMLNGREGGSKLVVATDLRSVSADPLPAPLVPDRRSRLGCLRRERRHVTRLLNDLDRGSRLVRAFPATWRPPPAAVSKPVRQADPRTAESHLPRLAGAARLAGGADGLRTLRPAHLSGAGAERGKAWGLAALADLSDVGIVAVPDIMPKGGGVPPAEARPRCDRPSAAPPPPVLGELEEAPPWSELETFLLQDALISHCRLLGDRVAVLDPQLHFATPSELVRWRQSFDSSWAALYYPWLKVRDPLRLTGLLRTVPPSGHVAGIYARVDLRDGVHQPPAGEVVEGARDLAASVDEVVHGMLNTAGINLIQAAAGRGVRVMGARTLASDAELRYVNVRRLLAMLAQALEEGLPWSVAEPNDAALWSAVERVVGAFLRGLWRRGMLDGERPEDAWHVRCDATTNPPQEVEAGRLICLVGLRPPWPAEFVEVRIGRSEGRTEILEIGGRHG